MVKSNFYKTQRTYNKLGFKFIKEEEIMAKSLISLKILFTGIGVFLDWFFGGLDMLTYVLFVLIVVDYISAVMRGIICQELTSVAGIRKISQKILIVLLVGVTNLIDTYLIGSDNTPLRTAVTFFYIANQGISLLENATIIGLPVPKTLKDFLVRLQKEKNEKDD